jgi:hypothetical protein
LEVAILHQELSLGTVCRSEKADGDDNGWEDFVEAHRMVGFKFTIVQVISECADFIANY